MQTSSSRVAVPAVVPCGRRGSLPPGRRPALAVARGVAAVLRGLVVEYRRLVIALAGTGMAVGSYVLAMALRFDLSLPADVQGILVSTLPTLALCKALGFWRAGLLSGWWRHVSLHDVVDIVRGNVLGSLLFLLALVFGPGLEGFPRSVFLIDLVICTMVMAGVRVGVRVVRERNARPAVRRIDTLALIVGAGSTGIRLLEEIESRARHGMAVLGFVDDDPSKQGARIAGAEVLGTIDELPRLLAAHEVHEVLVAIPSAPGAVMRRIAQHCAEARVRHRVVPSLAELVEGRVVFTQVRDVKLDDLLAREPVRLDLPEVRSMIADRSVLVTGAAGSIGSELCRQVAAQRPRRLVLFDRHENGVFLLERELRDRFPAVEIAPVLGDILLRDQLEAAFASHRPALVFHAAAYKHVPLAELNVLQAVRNNVFGTLNAAQAAAHRGASKFVLVSTDKAVRPSSVMGVTKRAAELVITGLPPGPCRFLAVRFGNVLGSSGSVVPLFREQIARGGPVTVTDPEVTRYFMTIPEACQLILEASSAGEAGATYLLEMGSPVRIADLARQMIRLSGFEPDEDIAVVFTGLRPGEKLEEELIDEGERVTTTVHDRIRVVHRPRRALPPGWLEALQRCVRRGDTGGALQLLQQVVPGYIPSPQALASVGAESSRSASSATGTAA
jgi:FlaA1/EpsC-like NDP-sugar epimerase